MMEKKLVMEMLLGLRSVLGGAEPAAAELELLREWQEEGEEDDPS